MHLQTPQRQLRAERQEQQVGSVLESTVGRLTGGGQPTPEQAALLEPTLPGWSEAASRTAADWQRQQDAIAALAEGNPLLRRLKTLAGGSGLYRRLLVEQQRRAGVPDEQIAVWDKADSDAGVAAWQAIPDGEAAPPHTRVQAVLAFAREQLGALPQGYAGRAIAELQRRGLEPGEANLLHRLTLDLEAGRDIAAYNRARLWARGAPTPGLLQTAALRATPHAANRSEIASRQESDQLAELQGDPASAPPKTEPDSTSAPKDNALSFEDELEALGIAADDPAFAGVPATTAAPIQGYDAAKGAFTGTPPDDAEWGSLDEQGKEQLLRDAAALVDQAYGLPSDYTIEFGSLGETGPYGQYRPEKSQAGSGRLILDLTKFDRSDGGRAIAKLLHELDHVYQAALMRDVVKGEIGTEDPRHPQIELFILSQGFYDKVSDPVRAVNDKYYDDPREGHSQRAYEAWKQFFDTGTLASD